MRARMGSLANVEGHRDYLFEREHLDAFTMDVSIVMGAETCAILKGFSDEQVVYFRRDERRQSFVFYLKLVRQVTWSYPR
jgi:hypothetical protein